MGGNPRSTVNYFLGICLACGSPHAAANGQDPAASVASPADAAQARQEYNRWVEQESRTSLDGLKLIITAIEGEETDDMQAAFGFRSSMIRFGCKVSSDGAVSYFSISNRGTRGGSGSTIAPADFKRLDKLLANLPDDRSRLTVAGRRLLVQAASGTHSTVKVYDRAHAPAEILEILRLSRSRVRAWLPEFGPQSEIDARPHKHDGFLCLSPDRTRIIFTGTNRSLQFWEPITHEPLGEIRAPSTRLAGITFSPDGSLAVLSGGGRCALVETERWKPIRQFEEPRIGRSRHGLSNPRFTPDGKHLVLQCSEPSLRIFDTATWERVARLPDVPEDTVQYIPASTKRSAVLRSNDGIVSLWDLDRQAIVAELDKDSFVSQAVFSPNESLVAVVTHAKARGRRLRLYETKRGEFVHELRPFEQTTCEQVRAPFWSPDGEYLLAATKAHPLFTSVGIGVWNVKTGRHRGEFTGCPTKMIGMALLPDDSQLVAGCADGKIRFWDFPAAMKQIREFENSVQSD